MLTKLNQKLANKKKKGFTLIELIAVIAIIAILAAILVPKVTEYMKEAKKTKIIDQCRKAVIAFETVNLKKDAPAAETMTVTTMVGDTEYQAFITDADIPNIKDADPSIENCRKISNNKVTFTVGDDGNLDTIGNAAP